MTCSPATFLNGHSQITIFLKFSSTTCLDAVVVFQYQNLLSVVSKQWPNSKGQSDDNEIKIKSNIQYCLLTNHFESTKLTRRKHFGNES